MEDARATDQIGSDFLRISIQCAGICNDDAVAGSYMGDIDTIEAELKIAITGGKNHIIQFGIH